MSFVAVSVAGMGVGVAGKIFASVKAAKAAKANQQIVNDQLAEAKTDQNRSFLDSATAKDAVRAQNENLVDARKNIAGRAAINGASDEAVVAGNTGINKSYSDSLSRIAGQGTSYQELAKSRKNQILGMQMNLNQQKAESAANVSEAADGIMQSSALMSGMGKGLNSPTQANDLGSTAGMSSNKTKIKGQDTVNYG